MSTQLQAIDIEAPIGSINAFETHAFQIPMLSEAQELALARAWHERQDIHAAKQLVLAHLRFVVKIARNYAGYGLQQADLIQEGNIGLMKAVKRFDPNMGVRLAAFAVYSIKSEIHEFVLRNWRLVRIATTKAQRKLFFNLRRMKKGFNALSRTEAQDIADELGVSAKEVHEMEMRLQAQDIFLDGAHDEDSDPYQCLPSPEDAGIAYQDPAHLLATQHEEQTNGQQLQQALMQLPERTREIICARHLNAEKTSLHTLAEQYGISAERVRQVERSGMVQLRRALEQKSLTYVDA